MGQLEPTLGFLARFILLTNYYYVKHKISKVIILKRNLYKFILSNLVENKLLGFNHKAQWLKLTAI